VTLRTPFLLSAGPATISASVGLTAFEDGDDADSLLSRADAAMYAAKRSGGGRCVLAE
jgi:predicted signal transduction protein with EAL and GGDEF domain